MYIVDTVVLEQSEEDDVVVVRFVDLPITTQGDDLAEAIRNAEDAARELMFALRDEGIVEQFLAQYNVTIHDGEVPDSWTPRPQPISVGPRIKGMFAPLAVATA